GDVEMPRRHQLADQLPFTFAGWLVHSWTSHRLDSDPCPGGRVLRRSWSGEEWMLDTRLAPVAHYGDHSGERASKKVLSLFLVDRGLGGGKGVVKGRGNGGDWRGG